MYRDLYITYLLLVYFWRYCCLTPTHWLDMSAGFWLSRQNVQTRKSIVKMSNLLTLQWNFLCNNETNPAQFPISPAQLSQWHLPDFHWHATLVIYWQSQANYATIMKTVPQLFCLMFQHFVYHNWIVIFKWHCRKCIQSVIKMFLCCSS